MCTETRMGMNGAFCWAKRIKPITLQHWFGRTRDQVRVPEIAVFRERLLLRRRRRQRRRRWKRRRPMNNRPIPPLTTRVVPDTVTPQQPRRLAAQAMTGERCRQGMPSHGRTAGTLIRGLRRPEPQRGGLRMENGQAMSSEQKDLVRQTPKSRSSIFTCAICWNGLGLELGSA